MAEEELHESNVSSDTDETNENTQEESAVQENVQEDTTSTEITEDEEADTDEDVVNVPLERVEAILNSTADKDLLSPQMRRMVERQEENTRRVEESIKGTKANPGWFVPLFCFFMILGLIWAVVYYINGTYPIPNIGAWNLAIAFALIMIGFIMTMWWR
ncbi:MAG: cell division protein CrgA [Bifidobacteriaceae bacterium]|nr:cell division protein CrgA [Bifidobacteriaceae bacterium]